MKDIINFLLLVGLSLAHPVLPGTRDSNAGVGWDLKHVREKSANVLSIDFENKALFNALRRSYRIPDQLSVSELNEEDTQIYVFTDCESLANYQNKLHGTSSDSAQPTFEDDYLSKSVLKALQQDKIAVVVKHQKRLFGWEFNAAKPTKNFEEAVNKLPANCESNEEYGSYFEFIKKFGSHVLTSAEVGGEIAHIYSIPSTLIQLHGQEWVVNKIQQHINLRQSGKKAGLLSLGMNALTYEVKVHGAAGSVDKISLWEKEIERTPAILNPKFTLISAFIADNKKKTNLDMAIASYMTLDKEHSTSMVSDTPPSKIQIPNIGFPYDMVTERFRPVSVFKSVQWNPDCSQYDYCYKGLIKPSFPAFSDNEAFSSEDTYQRYTDTESYLEEKSRSFTAGGAFYNKNQPPAGPNGGIATKNNAPPLLAQVSFNRTRYEVTNVTKNTACNVGSNEVVKTMYSLEYFEDIASLEWPVSSVFANDAKAIGTEYDAKRFSAFVRKYGTHFLNTATFGGIWNFTLAVNTETVNSKSSQWVSTKFGAALNVAKAGAFNVSASETDKDEIDDAEWQASSHNMTQIYGGNQNLDSMTWVNSVEANPELLPVYSEMLPITTLIQQLNPEGATQLMDYLSDYVLYGQVNPNNQPTLTVSN